MTTKLSKKIRSLQERKIREEKEEIIRSALRERNIPFEFYECRDYINNPKRSLNNTLAKIESAHLERMEYEERREKLSGKMSEYGLNIKKMDNPYINDYAWRHDISLRNCITILLILHKKSVAKQRKNYAEAKSLMYK